MGYLRFYHDTKRWQLVKKCYKNTSQYSITMHVIKSSVNDSIKLVIKEEFSRLSKFSSWQDFSVKLLVKLAFMTNLIIDKMLILV
jgi:hypothetical protein